MITIDELKQRFPVQAIVPYGDCIVVPGAEFDPDWEVSLADQGFSCRFTDLDGRPVTLVRLHNRVPEGKVVYIPPPKPKPASGNPHPKMPWLKDMEFYSPEEDAFIIELWKKGASLAEIGVEVHKKYPKRSGKSVTGHIYQLQRKSLIEKRYKPKSKVVAKAPKATESTKSTEGIKGAGHPEVTLEDLSESYAALSKDLEDLREFVEANLAVKLKIEGLERDFKRHKHAQGSGEACIPMEASR